MKKGRGVDAHSELTSESRICSFWIDQAAFEVLVVIAQNCPRAWRAKAVNLRRAGLINVLHASTPETNLVASADYARARQTAKPAHC